MEKNKLWDQIRDENGKILYGNEKILKRQVRFYKDLYTTQNITQNRVDIDFFQNSLDKRLSKKSKKKLDSVITKLEIARALKKMLNNKSPGSDGIAVELYKVYWHLFGDDLFEVFKAGLDDSQLAYTQYLAVKILLYKKNDRADIKNWRPISLLNVDYKMLSKVLAERLKSVLHEIIHTDQKGCIPGRYIGENIRHVDDLLFEIENQSEEAILLLLDQEKAFDQVEREWIFSTLKIFNFGSNFISWLKTLYRNAKKLCNDKWNTI